MRLAASITATQKDPYGVFRALLLRRVELAVIHWPGHIKPGTVLDDIFGSLDWLPMLVDIGGGPKGDGLKKQIEAGRYAGIVETTSMVWTSATIGGPPGQVGARRTASHAGYQSLLSVPAKWWVFERSQIPVIFLP